MKHFKGYTLIEVLVSVAIIATITGVTLVNFRYGNKNWALTRASQKVSQDVRGASNKALSSPSYTCPGSEKIDGYGVYFSTSANTSYIVFADCDGNNSYGDEVLDVKIETISIESDIKISGLKIDNVPVDSFSVVFVPPDPATNFSSGSSGTATLSIISDTSKTKQITINSKGNIDIQ